MKTTIAEFVGRIYLEIEYKHNVEKLVHALKIIPKIYVEDLERKDFESIPHCGVMTWVTFENMKHNLGIQ
jgi:hypothetical protein